MYGLEIITPISEIEKNINIILSQQLNSILNKINKNIENDFKNDIIDTLKKSDTYIEITTPLSKLNVEIGIPALEIADRFNYLFNFFQNEVSLQVLPLPTNGKIGKQGGFLLTAIHSSFANVIHQTFANFTTEKGDNLPWLKWLLIDGDSVIISSHHVVHVNPNKTSNFYVSRTGGAIMRLGGRWRVPYEHAGTMDDNWITRVIDEFDDSIAEKLSDLIEYYIKKEI